jgi:hypothetical protein
MTQPMLQSEPQSPAFALCALTGAGAAHRWVVGIWLAPSEIRLTALRKKTYPDKGEALADCAGTAEFRSCSRGARSVFSRVEEQ